MQVIRVAGSAHPEITHGTKNLFLDRHDIISITSGGIYG